MSERTDRVEPSGTTGPADAGSHETLVRLAKMIAWDEYGEIEHSWCNNHVSCGYGCCGGGKDVDREALQQAIVSAFRELLAASASAPAVPRETK
jgi:hypothetical protein